MIENISSIKIDNFKIEKRKRDNFLRKRNLWAKIKLNQKMEI